MLLYLLYFLPIFDNHNLEHNNVNKPLYKIISAKIAKTFVLTKVKIFTLHYMSKIFCFN